MNLFKGIRIVAFLSFFLLVLFAFSVKVAQAASSFLYDPNGNMTSDGQYCYDYNEANQLSKVKNCSNNQIIAEYVYDYNGNRIAKKEYTNGVLVQTIYSPTDSFQTTQFATGTAKNTTYYFANNQLIAKKDQSGVKEYSLNDQLGSNSVTTDQSGNVVENTTYDPWGLVLAGGTQSKFQYTGQEKDSETGLNYYNARYYNPSIRRFTQADTIYPDVYNPQTLNRYAYVTNNPLRYTDPTGHMVFDSDMSKYDYQFIKDPNYIFLPEYKSNENATYNFLKSELGIAQILPSVPGVDILNALASSTHDLIQSHSHNSITFNDYMSLTLGLGSSYAWGKINGGIADEFFPGNYGSDVKNLIGYVGGKVTEKTLDVAESNITKKVNSAVPNNTNNAQQSSSNGGNTSSSNQTPIITANTLFVAGESPSNNLKNVNHSINMNPSFSLNFLKL